MDFTGYIRANQDNLEARCHTQRVPGLDPDDVYSEMVTVVWRACQTYQDDRGPFGPYWWSMWLNRRATLTRNAMRTKRPRIFLSMKVADRSYTVEPLPEVPEGTPEVGQRVWTMLAMGEQVKDVIEQTGLSRRGYYNLIQGWRRPQVKDYLSSM